MRDRGSSFATGAPQQRGGRTSLHDGSRAGRALSPARSRRITTGSRLGSRADRRPDGTSPALPGQGYRPAGTQKNNDLRTKRRPWKRTTLAGLAVGGRRVAPGAVLLHLQAVRRVATVLLRNVVALLANLACEGDLGANVCRLTSHYFSSRSACEAGASSFYDTADAAPVVARAGFEPATSRL